MTDKKYMTLEEVAQNFRIHPTTVYRLTQKGVIPGFKIGGQWRFSEEMLRAWVANSIANEQVKVQRPSTRSSKKKKTVR